MESPLNKQKIALFNETLKTQIIGDFIYKLIQFNSAMKRKLVTELPSPLLIVIVVVVIAAALLLAPAAEPAGLGNLEKACTSNAECKNYIFYNLCEAACANTSESNNKIAAEIEKLPRTCDPTLAFFPAGQDCKCINNQCSSSYASYTCSTEHPEFCERGCNEDVDCYPTCNRGCGCLTSGEICASDIECFVPPFSCKCVNNKCEVVEFEKKVVIVTDKAEYELGETLKLTVNNNLSKKICFESCNPYFFEKENLKWEGFLIKLCEASFITECLEPGTTKVFEEVLSKLDFSPGTYRIGSRIFVNCVDKTFNCEKDETAYTSEFTIKEGVAKNCNEYEMPMTDEERANCTCQAGQEKFNCMVSTYCATNSQKSCTSQADCPSGEHCISNNGKNWFCTGQKCGCYHYDPQNPTSEICVD